MDNMQLLIGLLLIGGAVGLALYAVLSQVNEKSVVRNSLRQLDGYEVENVRDQELLAPISQRAVAPVMGGLTNVGRRLTPTGYADSIRKKFIESGNGSAEAVDRFMAIQVIMLAGVIPVTWFFYFYNPVRLTGMIQLISWGLICAVLIFAPYALLSRRVEERQHEL